MRTSWLLLSLCLHGALVGAVGWAGYAMQRAPRERPEFGLEPSLDAMPVPTPASAPAPEVAVEPAPTALDVLVEPPDLLLPEFAAEPDALAELDAPVAPLAPSPLPTLHRVTAPTAPIPADAAEAAEPPPGDVARVEPRRQPEQSASAFVEARPLAQRNRPPEYPAAERALGHEGTVKIAVDIDAFGDVIEARLHEGCPYPALNRAALLAVRAWRFQPAQRDGVPIADTLVVPVVFALRTDR